MYGSDKRWEPLRRSDWLSICYRGANTDLTKDNYLTTAGNDVTLTLNHGAKVGGDDAVEINISAVRPRLAKILLSLRPHVTSLKQSEYPLVFCMAADDTAMSPGCFSQRLPGI